jgi:predicted ATP-dependent endonuclease of OLD family
VRELASILETSEETLSGEAQAKIGSVATMLGSAVHDEGPQYVRELSQLLHDLAEHEADRPPWRKAIDVLSKRKPTFLRFSDDERLLESEYNIDKVWQNPPAALRNLVRLASLDLEALHKAVTANDYPNVAGLEEQANDLLKQRFYDSWSQSKLAVRFRTEEKVLKILIRGETPGESQARFTSIGERSDGLRQFVSLTAFADPQPTVQAPILLIDEVETHLHYNAQADLVQMLAGQEIASKVIYTTHSMGCLPEDLGTGVRLVESQEPESFTSRIENAFWTSNRPGFSPLLFGMGASALAFIPLRNAVITEGASDIILWPRLLREATGRTHLDLQVAPGLSEADRPSIIVLDAEAPRTAYLLDADEGGNNLRSELIGAGISEQRIFSISDAGHPGLVVEDLLDATIYVLAVNAELHRSNGDEYSFPAHSLPEAGRPTAVKDWCSENDIREPGKVAVAYRVLEEGVGVPILAKPYRESLAQLFLDISAAL